MCRYSSFFKMMARSRVILPGPRQPLQQRSQATMVFPERSLGQSRLLLHLSLGIMEPAAI